MAPFFRFVSLYINWYPHFSKHAPMTFIGAPDRATAFVSELL
jgi:hypothetical protein